MRGSLRILLVSFLASLSVVGVAAPANASSYNGHPKLVVIVVIDQFRGDYLERYRDQFVEGGFRLFLDRGAYFTDCNYDYANTRTAPGHATLASGAYSNGHGIIANEWWDPQKKHMVSSVEDDTTHLVGIAGEVKGASPHNLLASTLGDELKLATGGRSHVFGVALKDRAAILPAGYAADAAYWIDQKSGTWVTSTYYRSELPKWAADFNSSNRVGKYWDRQWTDGNGATLGSTAHRKGKDGLEASFYEVVGSTPFANDYELEFAKELVLYEQLGLSGTTDLLIVSLSANDILGHQVGPDSPEMAAMALALDRQLAEFFNFLGHQVGLANVWIALSADHGVAPLPTVASKLHVPATYLDIPALTAQINKSLAMKFTAGKATEFVKSFDYPDAWLNEEAFSALKVKEEDAERATGEAMKQVGLRGYFTRWQLAQGTAPDTELGHRYLNSYAPTGGWYVLGIPVPYAVGGSKGTDHATPYSYDTHVPLAFFGLPFQLGTYRTHAEPVDLATTLASLLGINAPTHAIGRVLTEALATHHGENSWPPAEKSPRPPRSGDLKPAGYVASDGGRR
ncbi:MAG TPA: alkaline phosphatase family protein [Terriglobales bacterium]|nr:alkaline phosphatase family protein [Terriglobales bacterium]